MTHISALPHINHVDQVRSELLKKLNCIGAGDFVVAIGRTAERKDDELKRQLKPALQRALRERIASLEFDLAVHGFDVT